MGNHQPANVGSYRHCGSRDIIFLLIGEQDFTFLLKSVIIVISEAHGIKAHDTICSVLVTHV